MEFWARDCCTEIEEEEEVGWSLYREEKGMRVGYMHLASCFVSTPRYIH